MHEFSELVMARMAMLMDQSRSVLLLPTVKAREFGKLWREKCTCQPLTFSLKLARTSSFRRPQNLKRLITLCPIIISTTTMTSHLNCCHAKVYQIWFANREKRNSLSRQKINPGNTGNPTASTTGVQKPRVSPPPLPVSPPPEDAPLTTPPRTPR